MKNYTKTGDRGDTSLSDGSRVPKDDSRIVVLGELDELTSLLGWCRAAEGSEIILARGKELQRDLHLLCAEMAVPSDSKLAGQISGITRQQCDRLESWIDEADKNTKLLNQFVLPGGTELACRLHLARTCCRRLERSVVTLMRTMKLREEVLVYLNRLSDLLFAWSRQVNHEAGIEDTI